MDAQMYFRSLLLQLQERLSERDRRHLHFLLGDTIPRQLRNDPSIAGTLELLETLFDQGKISDQDFGYLIQAFREIGCSDIVKRLELHQKTQEQRKLSKSHQVMNELFNDNECDKITSAGQFFSIVKVQMKRKEIDEVECSSPMVSSNSFDSPDSISSLLKSNTSLTKDHSSETHIFHSISSTKNNSFFQSISFSKLKIFLVVSLMLNILFFLFLCILIGNGHLKKSHPPLPTSNQDLKEGVPYGTPLGTPFNDGTILSLSCEDRCIGVEAHWRRDYLYSIRFLYDRNSTLLLHHGRDGGTHQPWLFDTFMLRNNEEINAITVYEGVGEGTTVFIVGIEFHTTHGRSSKLFGSNDGTVLTESFPGYAFSYAKGYADYTVNQLEFTWCHMCSKSSRRL